MSDGVIYGNYFLLGRLAQGGMAEVFLGKHLDNSDPDQLLAIKRMLPRFTGDPDFVSMFSDEARIAASLSHPNICKVFDQGEFAGQLYLVMEFIHGKDLKVAQRRADGRGEPIPFRFVAHIIAKIAEALDYAHRKTNADGASGVCRFTTKAFWHLAQRTLAPRGPILASSRRNLVPHFAHWTIIGVRRILPGWKASQG